MLFSIRRKNKITWFRPFCSTSRANSVVHTFISRNRNPRRNRNRTVLWRRHEVRAKAAKIPRLTRRYCWRFAIAFHVLFARASNNTLVRKHRRYYTIDTLAFVLQTNDRVLTVIGKPLIFDKAILTKRTLETLYVVIKLCRT